MTSALEAALAYRQRGWSVIPVGPSKRPLVEWKEYQQRLPTETEIRGWWRDRPNAGVAIVTGAISGLVVVDVDVKHGGDPRSIAEKNVPGFIVRTGGGGYHLYYQHPRVPVNNAVDRKTGIDIRGDGGYVVAPPSRHTSGAFYEWQRGSDRTKLTPLPDFVLLHQNNGNGSSTASHEQWLTRLLSGVGEGERNEAATRLAGYYFGKKMPLDVVIEQMKGWNDRNDPPLPEHELLTTIHSVFKASERQPAQTGGRYRTRVAEPLAFIDFNSYMTRFGQGDAPWMVKDWMPDQTIAMMVGPPGSYKTWFLLDLAVSVAYGAPFLDQFEVLRSGPVLLIQQEDFHGQIVERLATIIRSRFDISLPQVIGEEDPTLVFQFPPRRPNIYVHPDRRFRFDDSTTVDALVAKVEQLRPRLVIIDPLYSTGNTEDYMANTVSEMFVLKHLRDQFGTSFLLSHHTKKRSGELTEREDAWGSQFLNAFIETGWQIRPRPTPGTILLRRHFKVRENQDEKIVTFNIHTEAPYRYEVSLASTKTKVEVLEELDPLQFLMQRPMTAKVLHQQMGGENAVTARTLYRRLTKLMEANVITCDNGVYSLRA